MKRFTGKLGTDFCKSNFLTLCDVLLNLTLQKNIKKQSKDVFFSRQLYLIFRLYHLQQKLPL